MNGAAHQIGAFATVTTLSLAEQRKQGRVTARPFFDGAVAAVLTGLPDKLDPPNHPNHRQFYHSLVLATGVGYVTYRAYQWEPTEDWERIVRWLIVVGGAAYLVHLVMDACTKKSLPLLGTL